MGKRGKRRDLVAASRFAMRSPLLPMSAFAGWADGVTGDLDTDCALLRERLRELIDRPEVRDALFVASPDLSESIDAWVGDPDSPRGQRVERSLVRYASRMAGRATPFGLFSGVSIGAVGETTCLELPAVSELARHTRLDNDYLFALGERLERDPEIRAGLLFSPNTSLYRAAGRLRYAEARVDHGPAGGRNRSHHLVAVERTDYLDRTLERAAAGATRESLARALVDDDPEIALDEALEFVDELIDSQLLVSRLAPAVTGAEPIVGMLETLEAAGATGPAAVLGEAQRAIEAIDGDGVGVDPGRYRAIATSLAALPASVELSRLFQVDMLKPAPGATLGRRVIDEIERAVEVLARMTRPAQETPISRFARAFSGRYEGAEVPLTLALDEELGIGFDVSRAPAAEAAPLLAGLHFPGDPKAVSQRDWGKRESHLLVLVERAAREGAVEIALGPDDVTALEVPEPGRLPDSFAVIAELAAANSEDVDRGRFAISMRGGFGPSGANLLGRFCHADPRHVEMVAEVVAAEEALQPEAVFAEVVHLPEGRIGNILCRPVLRDYEIPYLGISGAPTDRQIPLDDLMVSVIGRQVVLRSRRLDREVIPRLSTAHNYSSRSLGVYRFLCSLQRQATTSPAWSWGVLEGARFLPRVRLGKVVLSRARWLLSAADIAAVNEAGRGAKRARSSSEIRELRERVIGAARALRDRLGLPRFVELVDGDNELPVDFDNPLSVDSFAQLLKGRSSARLVEMLPAPDQLVARGPGGAAYVSQIVAAFSRGREPSPARRRPSVAAAPRRFPPGSPWLYAKLYTGSTTADDILGEAVLPIAREILEAGDAERWFFIRYGDPDWHLRLRFFGEPDRLRTGVLPRIERAVAALERQGLVRKLVLDTYERETERYGGSIGMELCEQLFWADSDAVAEIVSLLDGDDGAEARWRLALRGLDMLLDDLGLELPRKRALMAEMAAGFAAEHHADTALKRALGSRYRDRAAELDALLARDPAIDADHDLAPGFEILERRSRRLAPIAERMRAAADAGQLTLPIAQIASSLCHMYCNRLTRSAARAQEMVLYDLLRRHYERSIATGR